MNENLSMRPYQGLKDFIAMTSILAIGRKTDASAHYVHTGDLCWWMFYSDHTDSYWHEHIYLWERQGQTIGWSLLDPDWCSFDVYVLPELRGSSAEDEILDRSIDCLAEIVRQQGGTQMRTYWVAEHDRTRIRQLEQRAFQRGAYATWYLERSLEEPLPEPQLPDGYSLRQVVVDRDVKIRAAAAYRAFGSTKPFDDYWPRYQRFVDSPVYPSSIDLVVMAPGGDCSSFCIVWPDPVNHIGIFEPVGTHPDFQSKGLGKAVVAEGLRRLKNCGMYRAAVCAATDNQAAQRLYQAAGFQKAYQLLTYIKTIA
jgi:mycothiol synthase